MHDPTNRSKECESDESGKNVDEDATISGTEDTASLPSINHKDCNHHEKEPEMETSSRRLSSRLFPTKWCDCCFSTYEDPRYCCCSCCCGGKMSSECEAYLRRYLPNVIIVISCILTLACLISIVVIFPLPNGPVYASWLLLLGLITLAVMSTMWAARYYVVVKLRPLEWHQQRPDSDGHYPPKTSTRFKPEQDLSLLHFCLAYLSGVLCIGSTFCCCIFILTWSTRTIGYWMFLVYLLLCIILKVMHSFVFSTMTEAQYDAVIRRNTSRRRQRTEETRREAQQEQPSPRCDIV
jgi:hypothetical protein